MWRGVDDSEGRRALREAIEQGITFFDTALAYGNGHSEQVIGEELKHEIRSGHATVATKIPPMNRQWPGKSSYKLGDVFPAKYIASCTEQSLKNLRVDALHVQQLHVWNDVWLRDRDWEASYQQIVRLKEEGKVLHWGVSINDHAPETALRVLADPLFETAQVIYNIYDRSPERALFPLASSKPLAPRFARRAPRSARGDGPAQGLAPRFARGDSPAMGLGIIARVPFDEGALTGGIKATTVFPAGDWREQYLQGDRRAEAERRGKALAGLLEEGVRTLPEVALRVWLSSPAGSTVTPGM